MEFENYQYQKVAEAIRFIRSNFRQQPSLRDIADFTNTSAFHFQKIFKDWAGVSPKKFLQYTTIEYAKSCLRKDQPSLFSVTNELGLSGTGRLHDLFITIEGMTPAEYKNGGKSLTIFHRIYKSPFGPILIAETEKGICYAAFIDELECTLKDLRSEFPEARIEENKKEIKYIDPFFTANGNPKTIKLHIKGTQFHLKVWEALLKIPEGKLTSYSEIAKMIENPKATRAVGSAIGSNPIAYLIPCHRVIRSSGHFGEYKWDQDRKMALIGYEGLRSGKFFSKP